MKSKGLTLEKLWNHKKETIPVKAASMEEYQERPDVILVCVKGYSLDSVIPFIQKIAKPETIVIPILNIYGTGGRMQKLLPALSAADVGIAISDGAEIAREIADITISADDLYQIVTLKFISNGLMKRIKRNYRQIVGINTSLILLGVSGVIMPTTSALLHNTSTLLITLKSMNNLLS
jgi:ketopantoate reductase